MQTAITKDSPAEIKQQERNELESDEWNKIKWLYLWKGISANYVLVIARDDGTTEETSMRQGMPPIKDYWDQWMKAPLLQDNRTNYEYSPLALLKERRHEKLQGISYIFGAILHFVLTMGFMKVCISVSGSIAIIAGLIAILVFGVGFALLISGLRRIKGKNKIISLSIHGNNLVITNIDGNTETLETTQVIESRLDSGYCAQIRFRNGTIIRFLERFCYWPHLRYILHEST